MDTASTSYLRGRSRQAISIPRAKPPPANALRSWRRVPSRARTSSHHVVDAPLSSTPAYPASPSQRLQINDVAPEFEALPALPSRASLPGRRSHQLASKPPWDTRRHDLVAGARLVIDFYTTLSDMVSLQLQSGTSVSDAVLRPQLLSEMLRVWMPFEQDKINLLLDDDTYHQHFIDADAVLQRFEYSPDDWPHTVQLLNLATFLHYIWQLPTTTRAETSLIPAFSWPYRSLAELQDARRVFFRDIVSRRQTTEANLSQYASLSTQVFLARYELLLNRYQRNDIELGALIMEARADMQDLLSPNAVSLFTQDPTIHRQWRQEAQARLDMLGRPWESLETVDATLGIAIFASETTAFVQDLVSRPESSQSSIRIQRSSAPASDRMTGSHITDSPANITGWAAESDASASQELDALERMRIFQNLMGNDQDVSAEDAFTRSPSSPKRSRYQSDAYSSHSLQRRAPPTPSVSGSIMREALDDLTRSMGGNRSGSRSAYLIPGSSFHRESTDPRILPRVQPLITRHSLAPGQSPGFRASAAVSESSSLDTQLRRDAIEQLEQGDADLAATIAAKPLAQRLQLRNGFLTRVRASQQPSLPAFGRRLGRGERLLRFDSQEAGSSVGHDLFLGRESRKRSASTSASTDRSPTGPQVHGVELVIEEPLPAGVVGSGNRQHPDVRVTRSAARRQQEQQSGRAADEHADEEEEEEEDNRDDAEMGDLYDDEAIPLTATDDEHRRYSEAEIAINEDEEARLQEMLEITDSVGSFEGDVDVQITAIRKQLTLDYWFSRERPGMEHLPVPRHDANWQAFKSLEIQRSIHRDAVMGGARVPQQATQLAADERDEEEQEASDQAVEEQEASEGVGVAISSRVGDEEEYKADIEVKDEAADDSPSSSDGEMNPVRGVPDGDDPEDVDFVAPSHRRSRDRGQAKPATVHDSNVSPSVDELQTPEPQTSPLPEVHATQAAAVAPGGSQRRNRSTWTVEETNCLLDGMYALARFKRVDPRYQIYAQILSRYGKTGSENRILANRSNQDLKEEARLQLWRMKQEGLTIPYWKQLYFPKVFQGSRPTSDRLEKSQLSAAPQREASPLERVQEESGSEAGDSEQSRREGREGSAPESSAADARLQSQPPDQTQQVAIENSQDTPQRIEQQDLRDRRSRSHSRNDAEGPSSGKEPLVTVAAVETEDHGQQELASGASSPESFSSPAPYDLDELPVDPGSQPQSSSSIDLPPPEQLLLQRPIQSPTVSQRPPRQESSPLSDAPASTTSQQRSSVRHSLPSLPSTAPVSRTTRQQSRTSMQASQSTRPPRKSAANASRAWRR